MCDDACCDIAHRPSRFVSRCAMMHLVIFWPRDTKPISHIDRIDSSVDVRWCILWFSGQEILQHASSHIDRLGCAVRWCMLWFLWPIDTKVHIAHRSQPSATHPRFWQTCLFKIFPTILTTISGSQFWEIVKRQVCNGVSCRRLVEVREFSWCFFLVKKYKSTYRTSTGESNRSMSAVGNSPPFLTNLHFHDFPKYFNHD